jgi:O-antigen biosynthesis protein WbqV
VLTNVKGTWHVVEAVRACGAAQMVLISTDKAVNPTSIMGATKRIAEAILPTEPCETHFCAVRFGNVLGSAGSVVPIFQRQIERGGPVTVTHPDVERYFMTAREAAGLILTAASIGDDSGVYMLDMGVPVKIDSLARTMIELSGLVPGRDIEIQYTGLKPGEKFTEVLSSAQEVLENTAHEKVFHVQSTSTLSADLDDLDKFVASARSMDREAVKREIRRHVPEYGLPSFGSLEPKMVDRPAPDAPGILESQAGDRQGRVGKPRFLGR